MVDEHGSLTDERVVYPTMWRPVLTFGLPRDYMVLLTVAFGLCIGLTRTYWISFVLVGVLYVYGFLRAREDPEFFAVWVVRLRMVQNTKNNRKYGGNLYVP